MSQDPSIPPIEREPMRIFESAIFSKNKLGAWKRYYGILWDGGIIHIYKNRKQINTKPITTIDLCTSLSIKFSSTSTINMIKFNIVTSTKTYNLASAHCNTTDAWIKHANTIKNLYSYSNYNDAETNKMVTEKKCIMTGWLERKTKLTKTWRRNWCVLANKTLTWYDKNQQKKDSIDLCDIKIIKHYLNTLQIITRKHRYMFAKDINYEGQYVWSDWINTFKNILKYNDCLLCSSKDNGFCSMKPLFKGTMSVFKENGESDGDNCYHYMIDHKFSCLVGFDENGMNEWKNALIKTNPDSYDEILDELKKDCRDFVDCTVDHEISSIGPFMIIDDICYGCQSKEEMEEWCAWIERLKTGPMQTADVEHFCFDHLFLLIDGYCILNQSVHISYDICRLVMNFVSLP